MEFMRLLCSLFVYAYLGIRACVTGEDFEFLWLTYAVEH